MPRHPSPALQSSNQKSEIRNQKFPHLPRPFYARSPIVLARALLGQRLVRVVDGIRLSGVIVETEAYLGAIDMAAHTYNDRHTPRNHSMYLGGGHAYVYFTYGMHFCVNVVAGAAESGTAVLIRALEPAEGIDQIRARRPKARRDSDLCSGPAKLCQALAIDRGLDGQDLATSDQLWIERARRRPLLPGEVIRTRIGVDYAGEWAAKPLRFHLRDHPHVSRL